MKKIIVGFTSLMAGGKGTAAAHLQQQYQAETFRFSTMLRDILDRMYISHERDNMIDLSVWVRQRFGQDILARAIARDVEKSTAEVVVVEGIRRQDDIVHLQKLPNFTLVAIEADMKLRHERLTQRGENPDDATKTWEQFVADHEKETEISIPPVMKQAQIVIDNNGTLEQFHKKLDNLIQQLRER